MSDRADRIQELAESYTEKCLAWVIGLPKPVSFIFVVACTVLAGYVGHIISLCRISRLI